MAVTSLPSYRAVLLQKYAENLLQPPRPMPRDVTKYLRQLDSMIPRTTAEASEKGFLKYVDEFSAQDFSCTPEYARKAPRAIIETVRRFLLYCIARDSGVDNLVRLSKNEKLYFFHLQTAYEWSWAHQFEHGWENTPRKIQLRAYEIFHLFIELPLRHLKVPLSAFLWHVRVHCFLHRLPRGSSLFERGAGHSLSTLQGMRSRGRLGWIEEILRVNDMILDADVDNRRLYLTIFQACKKEIAAERRALIPAEMRRNDRDFQHILHDSPEWRRFQSIGRNRRPEFAPLRSRKARTGDSIDKTRTTGDSKVEGLKSTLKGLIQKMRRRGEEGRGDTGEVKTVAPDVLSTEKSV